MIKGKNIPHPCPIQQLYNPYLGPMCWYISWTSSQGCPTFRIETLSRKTPKDSAQRTDLEKEAYWLWQWQHHAKAGMIPTSINVFFSVLNLSR